MSISKAEELLKKYREGNCSPEEAALIESWYIREAQIRPSATDVEKSDLVRREVLQAILSNARPPKSKIRPLWQKITVAACLLLCLGSAVYMLTQTKNPLPVTAAETKHIKAGSDKALLILADGRTISLGGSQNEAIKISDMQIARDENGQLIFRALPSQTENVTGSSPVNKIVTPRGGQYQVILPDQTHVWLNASSSINFPERFDEKLREVSITGEAYFEVSHREQQPFHVISNGQLIEVLGTHFNIQAYGDEPVVSTLLQGSVRINHQLLLKPGEQAVNNGNTINTRPAVITDVVAWKERKFKFTNKNIKELMNEIARWYDVEIVYKGDVSSKYFSGSISRFDEIYKLLNLLESTQTIHFKVEGRRIIVMP